MEQGCQIGHFCGHIKVTNISFAAFGRRSSLWPKATTFLKSQRGYLRPLAATVCCGQRPQHFKSHRSKRFWQACPAQLFAWWHIKCATTPIWLGPTAIAINCADTGHKEMPCGLQICDLCLQRSRQEHGQNRISTAAKASLSETHGDKVQYSRVELRSTSTFNLDNEVIR